MCLVKVILKYYKASLSNQDFYEYVLDSEVVETFSSDPYMSFSWSLLISKSSLLGLQCNCIVPAYDRVLLMVLESPARDSVLLMVLEPIGRKKL